MSGGAAVPPSPVTITDAKDPRLAPYRDLQDPRPRDATFIAESERVVRKLLASSLTVQSVLVTEPRHRALHDSLALRQPAPPVYLVPQAVMDGVAGFHVHRGCLALGVRPVNPTMPAAAKLVIALEDLVDVDNLGAIVRNACAFGADALLLSPRCADPYYRKAIRVAAGNTFSLPIVRAETWPGALVALRGTLNARLVATVVDHDATPLPAFDGRPPIIVVFGNEGHGLHTETRQACDAQVTISMSAADSLNVATACAVFLYQLTQAAPHGRASLTPVGASSL